MRTEIKKLHQKLGTTIVYVTHDQIEALTLSTRIAVMFGGYVQQLGTPKEIYDNPANMFVAELHGLALDEPVSGQSRRSERRAGGRGRDWPTGAGAMLPFAAGRAGARPGRDIILGIRPEAITDPDGADRDSRAIHDRRGPGRDHRTCRVRHIRRHQYRRNGRHRPVPRRRACRAPATRSRSPSTWTRRWPSTRRRKRAFSERRTAHLERRVVTVHPASRRPTSPALAEATGRD